MKAISVAMLAAAVAACRTPAARDDPQIEVRGRIEVLRSVEAAVKSCGLTRYSTKQTPPTSDTSVLTLQNERSRDPRWRCAVTWLEQHSDKFGLDVVEIGPEIVVHWMSAFHPLRT